MRLQLVVSCYSRLINDHKVSGLVPASICPLMGYRSLLPVQSIVELCVFPHHHSMAEDEIITLLQKKPRTRPPLLWAGGWFLDASRVKVQPCGWRVANPRSARLLQVFGSRRLHSARRRSQIPANEMRRICFVLVKNLYCFHDRTASGRHPDTVWELCACTW